MVVLHEISEQITSRSNIQLLWSEFLCHDFLQKLQQNYLVKKKKKWSCSVCIGICFYVYMMACLNYIASVFCIVCFFFLMCVYWMEWYEKVVCCSDGIFTKLHKSCLAILKGHP